VRKSDYRSKTVKCSSWNWRDSKKKKNEKVKMLIPRIKVGHIYFYYDFS